MKVSLIQINTVTGDIEGNLDKCKSGIRQAFSAGADIAVLPETAFTGYCVGALWDNIDFIFDQENCVRELLKIVPHDKCVIVGYVSYHGVKPDGFPAIRNSVAVINKSRARRYDKQLLANADHHEDKKYFKAGKKSAVFDVELAEGRFRIGVPICEDSWYINHRRNIPREMVDMGAQILISINQSYFYYGKTEIRDQLFSDIARTLHVPVVMVNSVGVGDIVKNIIVFDGTSFVMDRYGKKVMHLKRFDEDRREVNFIYDRANDILSVDPVYYEEELVTFNDKDRKYDEIIDAICFEQRELFKQVGIKKAQVHISGGVDSAVVMGLSILSMGRENCVFITNPTSLNSDSLEMVRRLGHNFGVTIHTNDLEEIYQTFKRVDEKSFGGELSLTGLATAQAVMRTVQGLCACHRFGSGIVACGNHTEIVLGWASFHDIGSIGVHSPIGDLTKTEVFDMCAAINRRFHYLPEENRQCVIPPELFTGKVRPAAELPDSKYDPIDYYIQSGLCAEVIRNRKSKKQLLHDYDNRCLTEEFFGPDIYDKYSRADMEREIAFTFAKSRISVFKAGQAAPILILTPRSRGFSNRETIINHYRP